MTDAVASASGTSIANRQAASAASLANSEETFLKLLTTQLKNQDPLKPLDSNEFTAQIVQMTGVEQQLLTNDLLSKLVGMSDGGLAGSVNLIGKIVSADTDKAALKDGAANWSYDLGRNAASVRYEVVNSLGATIWSKTESPVTSGEHTLSWDGKSTSGQQQAAGDIFTLKVTATGSAGETIPTTISATGAVTGVETLNGQTVVSIGKLKIPVSSVTSVQAAS
ncbi:MAG: flagellar hook capping FlgD N-terminal domain-containing protein [Caulobacter sp.]|nr:flagellar hook capping FlgD N-terminal domain-containing protein [Caulobacter sp.]